MPFSPEIINRTLATKHGEVAYKVVEILFDAGYEVYWVGGSVRDMLLGKIPEEIDLASSATPKDVCKLFTTYDDSVAQLGVVIVGLNGEHFEITTFREDHEKSDGRRPEKVHFSTKERDALRRDATINALYFNPITKELYDCVGGEKDLQEKLVRFIGDPEIRIKEDALRILRIIRLRANIKGQYEPSTFRALQKNANLAGKLSEFRILEELEKILLSSSPSVAIDDLLQIGVLNILLPELAQCKGIPQPTAFHHEGDVLNHLLLCTQSFTQDHGIDVRLAALFHDIGKPQTFALKDRIRFDHHAEVSAHITEKVLRRLQLPSSRRTKITWLIEHHMNMGTFTTLTEHRKAHWYFHPWFKELLELFWLDIAGTLPHDFSMYDNIIEDYNAFLNAHPRPKKPLLSGDEVMKICSMNTGEKVGAILQQLHVAELAGEIRNKADAKRLCKELCEYHDKASS